VIHVSPRLRLEMLSSRILKYNNSSVILTLYSNTKVT